MDTYLYFVLLCSIQSGMCVDRTDRPLVTDPSFLIERLTKLENTVNLQATTIQTQSARLQLESALNSTGKKNVFRMSVKRLLLTDPASILDRLTHLESTVVSQAAEIKQLRSNLDAKRGDASTYIRWGRKQCPHNQTELVYSGFSAGGWYDHPGAASEYICIPPDPEFGKTSGQDTAGIYGAEFNNNFFGSDANTQDIPCAVCRTTVSTTIMIPGKQTCYSGWTFEYNGYLASGVNSYKAANQYICMDANPEYLTGGKAEYNGKLVIEVLAKCGSLQCPPYKQNYPITCVVCSK